MNVLPYIGQHAFCAFAAVYLLKLLTKFQEGKQDWNNGLYDDLLEDEESGEAISETSSDEEYYKPPPLDFEYFSDEDKNRAILYAIQ